jgi:hypothetical protein
MKLENLVGKELCDAILERRDDTPDYEEVVLPKKDLPDWIKALSEKIGLPLISTEEYETMGISEDSLASKIDHALELADPYGGIGEGQTLYHGRYDRTEVLIMIWPWQDNVKVTLKKVII